MSAQQKVQQSLSGIESEIVAQDSGLAQGEVYLIIDSVLSFGTALLGGIALLALIWAGFQYITSAGNDNQVTKAKQTAFWAIVGIIIAVSAFIVLQFILDIFGPS